MAVIERALNPLLIMIQELGLQSDMVTKLVSGGSSLHHELEVSPEEFVDRAEEDFEAGGSAARLNAVTNAKRAINSQMDRVLGCFGYKTKRMPLPEKVRLLDEMGFVAPRILRRVARSRNLLEHEYHAPSLEEIEEALDIASLFVEAANRHLRMFEHEFHLTNETMIIDEDRATNELCFSYHEDASALSKHAHVFSLTAQWRDNGAKVIKHSSVCVTNDALAFTSLVSIVTFGDSDGRLRKAFAGLLKRLGDGTDSTGVIARVAPWG